MTKESVNKDDEELFEELCGESGTLVIWEKCDRLLSKAYEEPGGAQGRLKAINYGSRGSEHCALIFHKYLNPAETAFRDIESTKSAEFGQILEPLLSPEI